MRSLGFQFVALVLTNLVCLAQPAGVRAHDTRDLQASGAVIYERLHDAAELVKRGDYAAAESTLRRIVDTGDRSALTTASALHLLGVVYEDQRRYGDAAKHYLRALRIWESLGAMARTHRIESLANLSSLYLRTGQLTKAERLLQTINATEEAELDNSQRGAVLVSRADLAYSRHDFKQSQIWLEEAISLWERGFGPEDSNLVGPLNGLANVFIKIGDPANAIRCLQRAQSILEKNPNPVFLAHILVNFSTAQVMAGNTVAAESLLKKALEIASSTLGADSPLAGEILANYAAVVRKMDRKSESKQLAKRARQIRQATRSADSALSTIDVGQLARERR